MSACGFLFSAGGHDDEYSIHPDMRVPYGWGRLRSSMTVSRAFGFVLLETERVTTFGEIRALPFLVQAGGITVTL